MTCIIVEDQGPAQEILEEYIKQVKTLQLVATFTDVLEARDFLKSNPIDLLFLDINLPIISGMDFLRKEEQTPKTILTTAYSEFALECFEYNVIDYLLKPFSFDRFVKAVKKASVTETKHNPSGKNAIDKHSIMYVKSGTELLKLDANDILFIKSDGDYTKVITHTEKHLASHSLKEWTEKLDENFIQVHRSYIVHMRYIIKVANNKICIGKELIPIGRVYKNTFKK